MNFQRSKDWLSRLVPLYPGEGPSLVFCFIVFLLVNAGIIFGRNSSYSLFLIYFGVQYLPYMYFANAAFLILCSLVYTALLDRYDRTRILISISALFVATLVASRLILLRRPHWFFPVLFMEAQVIWYFTLMQFWTFVGDLFDARQAKRLFPLLAVGGPLGMVGVWLVNGRLIHAFGTESLLLVWAGLIFVATGLAGLIYRRYRPVEQLISAGPTSVPASGRPSEWAKIKGGLAEVGREPLLRSMAAYVLLLWTVYAIVDFCFNKTMREHYTNPAALAMFFGLFFGIQGLLCLVIQLLLTRPVIERLGVGTTINFHPGFLMAGTAWMSAKYGYTSVFTAKLGDASMLYTFSDSSYQLLYNPLAPDRRARVRGFIEGYIRPLSLAAAGILLLLGNRYLKPLHVFGREISIEQQLSWGAFLVAVVWLRNSLKAKKGYLGALLNNLRQGSPDLRRSATKALAGLKDPSSMPVLLKALESGNRNQVIAAIELLETFKTTEAAEAISNLLTHSDAHIRGTAAGALGRLSPQKYSDRLLALLNDSDARVRASAAEALGKTNDRHLAPAFRPLLKDPSQRVRVNAAVALAALDDAATNQDLLPTIAELTHGEREARRAAILALGRLPFPESARLLAGLLHDPELSLRCEAARGLSQIGSAEFIPSLVEALAGPAELRHEARRALAAISRRTGPQTIRQISSLALNSERVEIRSELADVLGRLRDPQVFDPLILLLKDPEWRVRWKVLKAFGRLEKTQTLPEEARAALFEYAREELATFQETLRCSQTLVAKPVTESERLLALALGENRARIEERVFRLLGVLCGHKKMHDIFKNLSSSDPRQRADALEALDSLAPKQLSRELLRTLEPGPARQSPPVISPIEAVEILARNPKPWIRACVAYYAGSNRDGIGSQMLASMLSDPDPAVQETCLYAGWVAFKQGWISQVKEALHSPATLVQRCARRILAEAAVGVRAGPATERKPIMLLTIEKVLFLKSVPLFADLDSEELAALAEIAFDVEYAAGQVLFEQGEIAHHLYVLVRGKVDVRLRVDSAERLIATMGEGEAFGEMGILDDEPRSATIRALEPAQVLKIDRESFRELILERPQIALAILKILSLRLRRSNEESLFPSETQAARPLG